MVFVTCCPWEKPEEVTMSDVEPRPRRRPIRFVVLGLGYLAFLYLTLFLLLMNPRYSAYDPVLKIDTYGTVYRFCDRDGFILTKGFTEIVDHPSWANRLFAPLDRAMCRLFPDYRDTHVPPRFGSWFLKYQDERKRREDGDHDE
jgi:hypothetical protein